MDLRREEIIIWEVRTEIDGREIIKSPKTATSIRKLGIGGLTELQNVLRRAWDFRRPDDPGSMCSCFPTAHLPRRTPSPTA